ncbi:histidinol-phosphatase [Chakrabartyella piscis]|uniref:histidinol-phosphatase n=1 Tax=Chakrabartyella piscis TaxID=2918914 RepID=UPI00295898CB|nr:histidinol-phosphatase [Chakrabartyella piscis]
MIPKANFHTHTTFCDGKESVEAMVLAAIDKGFTALGFSGHSYTDFDLDFCMQKEGISDYLKEVEAMKDKYKDQITIYAGVEQDIFAGNVPEDFAYSIGSVHYIQKDGQYLCVDWSEEISVNHIQNHFAGDAYAFAEAYFATVASVLEVTGADIIGHFDLVAKFNEHQALFDTTHPRYKKAACDAINALLPYGKPFEINTGAIYRGLRTEPYPSIDLLEEIYKKGGNILLSSDSHNGDSIGFYFAEVVEMVKQIGFTHALVWSPEGFVAIEL